MPDAKGLIIRCGLLIKFNFTVNLILILYFMVIMQYGKKTLLNETSIEVLLKTLR